jgi:hypothetical protein
MRGEWSRGPRRRRSHRLDQTTVLGHSVVPLVAYRTINAVLADKIVRYRKQDGELLPFLKRVMRNDFLDMVRRPVCPYDCPCQPPKQRHLSQRQLTRSIVEVKEQE